MFNYPQFTPGFVNSVRLTTYNSGQRNYLEPQNGNFQIWNNVFPRNARSVQIGAHFYF